MISIPPVAPHGTSGDNNRLAAGLAALRRGHAAQQEGDHAGAASAYREAASLRPADPAPHRYLAIMANMAGDHRLAEQSLRRALSLNPFDDSVHRAAGWIALSRNDAVAAERHYAKAAYLDESNAESWLGLAAAYRHRGELDRAAAALRAALDADPSSAVAAGQLGDVLSADGRLDDAAVYYRHALALMPDAPEALAGLGEVLHLLGRNEEALPLLSRAVELAGDDEDATERLAQCLATSGDREGARSAHRAMLRRKPARGASLAALLELAGTSVPQETLDDALRACADPEATTSDRLRLHHALGTALDQIGRYAEAFAHFRAYNELALAAASPARPFAQRIDEMIAFFTTERMHALAGQGDASARPVFIVGMPRSGTTLVEQILASHPLVFGAGELQYVKQIATVIGQHPDGGYPAALARMSPQEIRRMSGFYLQKLDDFDSTARHITDKMPVNFLYLGLITTLFPDAAIIHCRRDPRDNCLSCYFEDFSRSNPEFCRLDTTIDFYRQHDRIMAHWQSVLPRPILEISYEALVGDVETAVRRLLDHCGLPWDDACLAFHRNRRAVATPSRDQVRQPIYTRSIGRWRSYQPWIGELLDAFPEM